MSQSGRSSRRNTTLLPKSGSRHLGRPLEAERGPGTSWGSPGSRWGELWEDLEELWDSSGRPWESFGRVSGLKKSKIVKIIHGKLIPGLNKSNIGKIIHDKLIFGLKKSNI